MITEHNYNELMKNCIKWNNRTMSDRKKRLRYPYYEQQTGTPQREVTFEIRTKDHRHASTDPNTCIEYATERWKKKKESEPADAVELKMFQRDNPAIDNAIAAMTQAMNPDPPSEASNDSISRGASSRHTAKDDLRDDLLLDDELSPDDALSDEDEWTSKKRKRASNSAKGGSFGGGGGGGGGAGSGSGSSKRKASGRPTRDSTRAAATASRASNQSAPSPGSEADEKRHVCHQCGAKYKSLAGLSYHLAYVHEQPSAHPTHQLLSPNIQLSDFCDLCLGNAYMNKKTKQPEDLVTCHDCGRAGHPSCLTFSKNVTAVIGRYGWQCIECKSCTICGTSENDDKLLFCDDCDRGYHLYCLKPALEKAPDNEYSCRLCQKEFGSNASAPAK